MSSMATCPLTIFILHPLNKSPVRAEKCQAVVYWDRERQEYYVRPLTATGIRIRVHLVNGREFESRLYVRNFLRAFFPTEKV
jgi:hypothetical protein